jgi:nitrite reductase/ring-hydroxylating ferredoxin subunit
LTSQPEATRRQVLCGLAIALLAPAGLAACGDGGGSNTGSGSTGGAATSAPGSGSGGASGALAKVSDIPVGGGKIVPSAKGQVLLTQPSAGTIKAYNPTCTHQGFTVDPPINGTITCTQGHGSQFNAVDGSIKRGPAAGPLHAIDVKVDGDAITLA